MADDIEVHTVDEQGEHITRIIPGTPPATDHTLIPTAELEQLRGELAQLRLIARVNGGLHRSAHEDVEQAEAEIARLRAGESPTPAPEGVQLTPAQWIHAWNRATADERLAKVEQIQRQTGIAFRCQQQDHGTVLQELANVLQTINRVREFADQIAKGSRTVSREFIAQGLLRLLGGEPT
ncbi:hypothetical protein GCM10017559_08220 [Streptosporangium longisporum]|uniref:Uncharacterized protein n=1 Tax=Streptosporangium longisporum TaxID=46187 RepID=A0ABN3XTA1_9ACTN